MRFTQAINALKCFYSTYEELKRIQMLDGMSNPTLFLQYL